ncbi:MAG TPA: SGNH/GDSL hydrolase family protein [Reyranella sp.]|nr:SGNH/GDSL hydrolase family protein [Reyranella sp.]
MKSALKNILLVAVVVVACGLFLEAMTRLFVDDGLTYELEMWKYATDVKVRDFNPAQGHKHGANRNASLMSVPVRTNEQGFRGPPLAPTPAPGVARIAFVGDSTTMGWGVAEQETFAHQVIARLQAQGRKVDGFNEGVGNWNTTQELTHFREVGARMKPDIVVLTYFINDAEPIPTYPKESWLDLHSAAWIVLNYRIDSLIRTFGPRPDWKQYYRNLYNDDAAGWQQTRKAIAGFAEAAKGAGAKIIVFHLPELRELKPYPFQDVTDKVRKVVEASGMRFVDLLPTVETLDPASLWVTVPDPHPNGKADTAFTDGMLKELLPMLDELCRSEKKGC